MACARVGGGGRYILRRYIIFSIVWDFSCGIQGDAHRPRAKTQAKQDKELP